MEAWTLRRLHAAASAHSTVHAWSTGQRTIVHASSPAQRTRQSRSGGQVTPPPASAEQAPSVQSISTGSGLSSELSVTASEASAGLESVDTSSWSEGVANMKRPHPAAKRRRRETQPALGSNRIFTCHRRRSGSQECEGSAE